MSRDEVKASWPAAATAVVALAVALTAGCQNAPLIKRGAPPLIQGPRACADFTFSIYFGSRSASMTREAGELIDAAAQRAKGCAITGIVVVGLADAPGSADANLALSKRRADAVTRALHRRGFNAVAFQVGAAGDAGARNGVGEARPLNRRADVQIHLAPASAGRA